MRIAILAASLLAATPVLAQTPPASSVAAPGVTVSRPWARATAGRQDTGVAYFTLTSPVADRLTGATTPAAAEASVHQDSMDGGVMRMRDVPALDLPAGKAVELSPGGYHLMLMHLRGPLVRGQSIPLHLTFAHAASVDVTVPIEAIGAKGPGQ